MIRLDESMREEAIEAGWLAYAERTPGMRDAYLRAMRDWQAVAICADGDVIGCVMSRAGLVHMGVKPEWRGRWASRRVIREILSYGKKTTLMPSEDDSFVTRLGFKKEGGAYVVHR